MHERYDLFLEAVMPKLWVNGVGGGGAINFYTKLRC